MRALLRSWLYVPADDQRKLTKAAGVDADAVIFDLEDATAGDRKPAARQRVADVLANTDFGRSRRYVRINAYGTPHWRADIEATAPLRPDGYVLAKASSAEGVRAIALALRAYLPEADAARIDLAAIVTEDVEGVFAMNDTVTADPHLGTVLWGSEDLSASIGAWSSKGEDGQLLDVFRTVRNLALLTAARHGKRAIDTPYLTIGDLDGLRTEARAVAAMGFTGKQAIHPEQIPVINEAFVPPAAAVEAARALVAAFDADGDAVVRMGNEMADAPHLNRARALIEIADRAQAEQ